MIRVSGHRRLCAALMLFALVFASVFTGLSHGFAMPAAGGLHGSLAVTADDSHGEHRQKHHHGTAAVDLPGDEAPANPCKAGCDMCKDCSFCSMAMLPRPGPGMPAEGGVFRVAARLLRADISLPRLIEPPRV